MDIDKSQLLRFATTLAVLGLASALFKTGIDDIRAALDADILPVPMAPLCLVIAAISFVFGYMSGLRACLYFGGFICVLTAPNAILGMSGTASNSQAILAAAILALALGRCLGRFCLPRGFPTLSDGSQRR